MQGRGGKGHLEATFEVVPTSGDQLRNMNCHDYLYQIAIAINGTATPPLSVETVYNKGYRQNPQIKELYSSLRFALAIGYSDDFAYGDSYTEFLQKLEEIISTPQYQAYLDDPDGDHHLKEFYILLTNTILPNVFLNKNRALERTYKMIAPVLKGGVNQTSEEVEHRITKIMEDKPGHTKINTLAPQDTETGTSKLLAWLAPTYKPHMTTSLTSVRHYPYMDHLGKQLRLELRSGTQAQRHGGYARISPTFAVWVRGLPDQERSVSHLYINNLGLDRAGFSAIEGQREVALSCALHRLEVEKFNHLEGGRLKVAVVTLPADKHILSKSDLTDHRKKYQFAAVFGEFVEAATNFRTNPSAQTKLGKDFYISPAVKALLYPSGDEESYDANLELEIMTDLVHKSFLALGLEQSEMLSPLERNAVYFYFIKVELTNFLMDELNPRSYQMSCKDGIDRGGVTSAIYNLMKSIQIGHPMQRSEFECALHAAPSMVKGRGMNTHTRVIWNVIDLYVNAGRNPVPEWLVAWCNDNRPEHKLAKGGILKRLDAYIESRSKGSKFGFFAFSETVSKESKLKAAGWLRGVVSGVAEPDFKNYQAYHETLNNGALGVIYRDCVSRGLIPPLESLEPDVRHNLASGKTESKGD